MTCMVNMSGMFALGLMDAMRGTIQMTCMRARIRMIHVSGVLISFSAPMFLMPHRFVIIVLVFL